MRVADLSFECGTEADIAAVALALVPPFVPRVVCIHDEYAEARYPDCPHDAVLLYDSRMDDDDILLLASRAAF